MLLSGMSGNEIFCLSHKGFRPGDLVVGNSVQSLGIAGAFGSWGSSLAGGEITQITSLISEGRHAAIARMEEEAKRHGAIGVTGVVSKLTSLASYMEFLSQGTGVLSGESRRPFSTAASGVELYCHLDAGYEPVRFVMGNVAYALGIGRGLTGSLRTLAKGEVREFSQMYNGIRHLALARIQHEAAELGANSVVDIATEILPFGPGAVELLMVGTASHHAHLAQGRVTPDQVVTSELEGDELWNLARLGWIPVRLVMATSVYALGVAAGIGAMFKSMSRGELPEVTRLVYDARENCMGLLRDEATRCGAEQVVGNRLTIRELSPGLIEVVAIGTAVRRAPAGAGFEPHTPQLMPQAVTSSAGLTKLDFASALPSLPALSPMTGAGSFQRSVGRAQGCLPMIVTLAVVLLSVAGAILKVIFANK
jgi:uncharacterized protein YbjQ (UPF0145 family)